MLAGKEFVAVAQQLLKLNRLPPEELAARGVLRQHDSDLPGPDSYCLGPGKLEGGLVSGKFSGGWVADVCWSLLKACNGHMGHATAAEVHI